MEDFAELMQRLLEIQSGGRQRSPELIAEDERLLDGLQKRNLAGKTPPKHNRINKCNGDYATAKRTSHLQGQTVKQQNSLTDPPHKTTVVIEVVTPSPHFRFPELSQPI